MLERVLEHPHGQAVLEASAGDAEHALRILDSLDERRRSSGLAEVIRLPRDPILSFEDVYERAADAGLELDEQRAPFPVVVAGTLGLAAWLVLAAIAFGLYELATRWPA
jgi:hypothetical protein